MIAHPSGASTLTLGLLIALAAGCGPDRQPIRNPDPALRKTITQFAADAATRFPYPAEAERAATFDARAWVGYALNRIEVVNLTAETWQDVDLWVNRAYVIRVPAMEPNMLKVLPFGVIFDAQGNAFPSDNRAVKVESIELLVNGRLLELPPLVAP